MPTISPPDLVETSYEVLDGSFKHCCGDRWLERLYSGCRWAEGPVWIPAGRYLLWSDIPSDRILRWDETTGAVGVFREPSGNANGNTLDRDGRLVTCEQGNRRVTRTEHNGSITILAATIGGCHFNSPNDVVVSSDRSVWFTDPSYGILSNYEGERATSEIGACKVYRIDAQTGVCQVVADGFDQPNGLAFSLDERSLFVVDSGEPKHIRVFPVRDDRTLGEGDVFAVAETGSFDGIRLDEDGRIWAGVGRSVHCYGSDGTLLGTFHVPEIVANLTFGGVRRNQLFIAATTTLYTIRLGVRGADLSTAMA
jgi:gluconolactonase